ncbi:hypothetical protein FA95DRAFT_1587993 [Auriscalpium vulgare]|uniref:Uncharacterized protein n=1 Tax=Auriscalpium vulgare TaxID=40419 RepID=A0ACB8S121_9AGAM|nr:hypothetical protein FA95DRAFT_1587993 [Auriscalpium vulgare]
MLGDVPEEDGLTPVQNLTITFLVDNSIEWMTKLPPGFSHEMNVHLRDQKPPIDPLTGVPIADIENYCCGAHGFAVLIDTRASADAPAHRTLFDTGPDSKSLVRNIASMQVSPDSIERVVFSHWHADHTGGLLSLLALRSAEAAPLPVDVHPARPLARGIAPPSMGGAVLARIPADPSFSEIAAARGAVERHAAGHAVAGGTVWVSGEVPRVTPFEGGLIGSVRYTDEGEWVPDEAITDERYAVVDVLGKGLVIFSSCSHAGIVNVVKDAVAAFSRPVYMVIGGLHLAGVELADRIEPTVAFLARAGPTYVLPMHCTGSNAKIALEKEFGEGCVPAGVGHKVVVEGDASFDARLAQPRLT